MSTAPPVTPSGAIRFADDALPPLQAGEYEITVSQTVTWDGPPDRDPDIKLEAASVKFIADGPRFRLAPDDIYSLYPPKDGTGSFANSLPHVVFRRETLPWERTLPKTKAADHEYPWLALLLFDAGEFAQVATTAVPIDNLASSTPGIRGPMIEVGKREKTTASNDTKLNQCLTLEVPWRLFRTVAPRKAELPLLAHTRYVDRTAKEDIPGIGDGSFSVVLGNRLPAMGQRNVVALVSLEGHDDLLDEQEPAATPEKVRLVLLAQWSFVCGATIPGQEMTDICSKDMWLRVPPSRLPQDTSPISTALNIGHVPLLHCLRTGDRTVSWYRGPLAPVAPPSLAEYNIFRNADEALEYDEATGMFNASYAVAWQLGRMLGIQAPDVAAALYRWRHAKVAETAVAEAKKLLGVSGDDAAAILRDDILMSVVLDSHGGGRR